MTERIKDILIAMAITFSSIAYFLSAFWIMTVMFDKGNELYAVGFFITALVASAIALETDWSRKK